MTIKVNEHVYVPGSDSACGLYVVKYKIDKIENDEAVLMGSRFIVVMGTKL